MKWKIGKAFLSFAALLAVLMIAGVTALSTVQMVKEAWRWQKHTYEVSAGLRVLLSDLVDVETAERGYVISGDQQFLEPSNLARPQLDGELQNLRRLTIDNASQQRRLEQLGPLIEQRLAEAERLVGLRASGNAAAALSGISAGKGKQLMDAIRQIIANMENEEHRLLTDRDDTANVVVQRLQGTLLGSGVLGVLVIVVSVVLTTRENRKRRQAELSASRTLGILDFTLDGVLMFRVSTLRFFYANHGSVQQLGYSREELLGMSPLDLEPGLDSSGYRATIAPLIGGNLGSQTRSTLYHRKDGLELPVEIVLQAGEIVDGEQVMVAIVRDITARREADAVRQLYQERLEEKVQQRTVELAVTNERMRVEISERKKTELSLKESRAGLLKQSQLLEVAHDAIFVRDRNDCVIFWNSAAEQRYGWSREEALGKKTHILLQTIFPLPLEKIRAILLQTGYWEGELQHVARNGSRISVASRWSTERDEGGNPTATLEINNDITEQKRAQEMVNQQARLLDLAHDAIFVRDRNDCVTFWNSGAEQRYGWSREEAFGKQAHSLLRTIFPQPLEEIEAIILKTGSWEGRLKHITRDGAQIIVASRWSVKRDEFGNSAGILEINNDITEQIRVEEEIRRLNMDLEGQVIQRTAQLQATNFELQNAAEAKDKFLANMSHELRTPLNGILGFAEFLADGKPGTINAKQKECLEDILNSGRHLLELICDILDLAKVGQAKWS